MPLHAAVSFDQVALVSLLAKFGCEIDALSSIGYSPLHYAAMQVPTLSSGTIIMVFMIISLRPN
jgi:ankyrin repeat protein